MVSKNGNQAGDRKRRKEHEVVRAGDLGARRRTPRTAERAGRERDTSTKEERSSDHLSIDQDYDSQPVG